MKPFIFAMIVLLALLQYKLWFDRDGLVHTWQLQNQVQAQTEENTQLKQRNEKLKAEIEDLKTNLDAVEEHARNDLGMVKKGETYYQVIQKSE